MTLIVVYHDVANARKLEEFAKTAFAFNTDILIISRPMGEARSSGVPAVEHLAALVGRTMLVVEELAEGVDMFSPDNVYLLERSRESKELDPEAIAGELKGEGEVMLVFGAVDPPGLKAQVEKGVPVHLPSTEGLSEIGLAAIVLYEIRRTEGK